MAVRLAGMVIWFNQIQGHGLICCGNDLEVIVHATAVRDERDRSLASGQHVEFSLAKSAWGWEARDVVKLALDASSIPGYSSGL